MHSDLGIVFCLQESGATFIHIRVDKTTMRIKSLVINSSDHSTFATSQLSSPSNALNFPGEAAKC